MIERKAISRNISLLTEAGVEIESTRAGSYIDYREFEDAELHMLIDAVLSSRYITAARSKDLIDRICGLSSKYFKSSVKHIHSVNDWGKTDNTTVFYNIETIGKGIERRKQLRYDYNKYGLDKKLHKSSEQRVSPYQMVLHNRDLSSAMPYMYSDRPENIDFLADAEIIDQIIDWFGTNIEIRKTDDEAKVKVSVKASPTALVFWALQYVDHVEVLRPESLRVRIREALEKGLEKYQ